MVLEEYKDYFTDVYETDSLTVAFCNAEANRDQLSDMPHSSGRIWRCIMASGCRQW